MKKTVLIILVALALLVGCSKGTAATDNSQGAAQTQTAQPAAQQPKAETTVASEPAPAAAPAETPAAEPVAEEPAAEPVEIQWPAEPINLMLWYSISGTNGQFFESQVKDFLSTHPNINIELTYTGSYADSATKISAAKLAGREPDMVITSASQLYTGEDGNFSMEQNVLDPEFNVSDVQGGIMEYAMYEGRLAAVPFGISTQVMYYNKDLAAKAGYDLEANPPRTWEEFIEVAKAISTAGPKGTYGFDTSDSVWLFKSMLYQKGNKVVETVDGKITPVFDDESAVEVATFWKRMVSEKVMAIGQHDNAENKFQSGRLVFIAATSNRISKWDGALQFELGAIEMPYFDQPSVAIGGSTSTIMTEDYWKQVACWELMKYLLNTENQAAYALTTGYLPIRKSSLELPEVQEKIQNNSMFKVATNQLDYAWAYTHFGAMGSMDTIMYYTLDDIENGSDPLKALKSAVSELESEI